MTERFLHTWKLKNFRGIASGFLEENSPPVFALNFNEISLSGLVRTKSIREPLEAAEKSARNGDNKAALEQAMRAFRLTLSEYRYGRLEEGSSHRLYYPASDALSFLRFQLSSQLGSTGDRLGEALNRVTDGLGEAITVIAYNLDFDGYRYLRTYGPIVHELVGGEIHMEWWGEPTTDSEIVSRCVGFAINAALRLENKGRP